MRSAFFCEALCKRRGFVRIYRDRMKTGILPIGNQIKFIVKYIIGDEK